MIYVFTLKTTTSQIRRLIPSLLSERPAPLWCIVVQLSLTKTWILRGWIRRH